MGPRKVDELPKLASSITTIGTLGAPMSGFNASIGGYLVTGSLALLVISPTRGCREWVEVLVNAYLVGWTYFFSFQLSF